MSFRKQVNDSGMMLDVLHHLRSSNTELKQAAADLILIVKAYIVGAIGSCLKNLVLRDMLKKCNGIEIMVSFLQTTFIPLIINLNDALAKGSEDTEILIQYIQLDAVQLIWSCLRNADFLVQSSAATALCIILKNVKVNANVQMENSLDGIECIIDLLASKRKELLIPACTLIHNLAKDKNALSVLVEFNVASHLIRLIKTTDKKLLRQLCLAVASCCSFKKGCEKFADCGITPSLLKHLKAKNKPLRITAASALARIASLPNCPSRKFLPQLSGFSNDRHRLPHLLIDARIQLTFRNQKPYYHALFRYGRIHE
ncbi:armadillo repeat-containing protein 4 [Trichonephila clavipes]|nr:armadillo repeat-containing protein 4 [Trichonephila clavipes]